MTWVNRKMNHPNAAKIPSHRNSIFFLIYINMYNMIFTPQIEILSNFENMFPYTVYLPVSICMLCTLFDAYCRMCRMTWWMIAEPASLSNVHSTGCMQQHSVWHLMLKCFSRLSCKTSALCHMWPINICLFPLPPPLPTLFIIFQSHMRHMFLSMSLAATRDTTTVKLTTLVVPVSSSLTTPICFDQIRTTDISTWRYHAVSITKYLIHGSPIFSFECLHDPM